MVISVKRVSSLHTTEAYSLLSNRPQFVLVVKVLHRKKFLVFGFPNTRTLHLCTLITVVSTLSCCVALPFVICLSLSFLTSLLYYERVRIHL
jgi:hypothetical protein